MALKICLLAGLLVLLEPGLIAQTQKASPAAAGEAPLAAGGAAASASPGSVGATGGEGQTGLSNEAVPRVPGVTSLLRGFNAGLNYSGAHNSAIGWYSVMTPALSYAFSRRYSADVSSSIYFKRHSYQLVAANPPRYQMVAEAADVGDTLFGFHATFEPGRFEEEATFTLSAPTGDTKSGLGTGRVTVDGTNRLEIFHRQFGGFVNVGTGNSSVLFNDLVTPNSSSLGGLAHFMAGAENWFGAKFYGEWLIYEQLPFGTQTVFAPTRRPGQSSPPGSGAVVSTGLSEDNGITTYAGIPVGPNLMLSGYYSRSLRRRSDTVSLGFTWVLRGARQKSLIDRALEEAEKSASK